MENAPPLERLKPRLESMKTQLMWSCKNSDTVEFRIEYCYADQDGWRFALKVSDAAAVMKTCKEIITKMCADAIRVTCHDGGTLLNTHLLRVTESVIPLLDNPSLEKENTEVAPKPSAFDASFYGLSSPGDHLLHSLKKEAENNETVLKVQFSNEIRRLNDKIDQLKEKCSDKDNFIEVLENEIEALEAEIKKMGEELSTKRHGNDKRQDFLLAAGIGKVFNMNNHEIIGLAGILAGNDAPVPTKVDSPPEELLSPEERPEEITGKRRDDIKIIVKWLQDDLDDAHFQFMCVIINVLAANPELYVETIRMLKEKAKVWNIPDTNEGNPQPDTKPNETNNENI